ncbi:MAG: bifunctional diaminohydroxyphosphoribosylaminopyrimidine deaminase/5-amino-6-(5-phosphoribosylamino)uracil reductase RibD [Flavobacteriaceae bacterium]|nr:bifunctional diaminohydroxyphosphoribosylaminopyrimidine deaminase/5-amino-6-(5-phosphoribosylamino)uracil reductase RibD [Flavobacteriaceae bacterium]
MKKHQKYIHRCLQLAKNGLGTTYPNPMVGAVVVHNDKIIGEGWHYQSGQPHAEVNAIRSVKDKSLLSEATIYVNLEPCSHFGKTPPCANLIVEQGIKKVVIGTIDVNSVVCGNGISYLKKNGCEVVVGVLEEECKELNKRFFTFHSLKRPFVTLKFAETQNGFMDIERNSKTPVQPYWISNTYSQQQTHQIRTTEQAILVGATTVINDRPKLNARTWYGNNPKVIIIDKSLEINDKHLFLEEEREIIIFTDIQNKERCVNHKIVDYQFIDFSKTLSYQILSILYDKGIQSIIVEGGRQTLQTFLDENNWDEIYRFIGNSTFEKGLKAPKIQGKLQEIKRIKEDTLCVYLQK